jgi:hypothetical protein
MKQETKNRIRRFLRMQEYCPECGLEIPYSPTRFDEECIIEGFYIRCSLCKGAKPKEKEQ